MTDILIKDQYSRWVYPEPIDDILSLVRSGEYWEIGNPKDYGHICWPAASRADEALEILCGRCGSNQAAYYACLNEKWHVTGIDISKASLDHAEKLKALHHLQNLTLCCMDVDDVEQLEIQFDFVVCTGVLHHLRDPDRGLRRIASVLKTGGVANLMVYGKSLRLGVYLLQDAFRSIGLKQTSDDIAIIKSLLAALPDDHAVQAYLSAANDLHFDAGIADTFLNPVDRAYFVPEIFELTERAGLEFLSWCHPEDYSLEADVPRELPIWNRLEHLDERGGAHVCDLLTQKHGTHRWFAVKP